MIGLIIASHGTLSEGLINAMELIIGKQELVFSLVLEEGVSPETLQDEFIKVIKKCDKEDGVLILLDLFGGTPSNVAGKMAYNNDDLELVTGINLPMLLEVTLQRKAKKLAELKTIALNSGHKGILDVKKWIKERLSE
ncbi:PTS sugar transporter subunit IIA [Candidatus Hodarchaeum mangrovi]